MNAFPPEWVSSFQRRLEQAQVPFPLRPAYHKWVKFYLYFCQKFSYPASAPTALCPFLTKMAHKNYSIDDRHHAALAVRLLLRYDPQDRDLYLQLSAPIATGNREASPLLHKEPHGSGSIGNWKLKSNSATTLPKL